MSSSDDLKTASESARAILSCGSCRQRKLKCDRKEPCANCVARRVNCIYASHPRARSSPLRTEVNQQMDARIRQLENLVNLMVAQKTGTDAPKSNTNAIRDQGRSIPKVADSSLNDDIPDVRPGRMAANNNNEMVYFSGDHWSSIVDELSDIRQQLDRVNLQNDSNIKYASQRIEPMLLSGTQPIPDMQSIIEDMPPRTISDRLLYRYFQSTENSLVILHVPTFEKEYHAFWCVPESVSPQWLSLLYAILAMGTFMFMRAGEQPPGSTNDPVQMIEIFQKHSTECLIHSNYSTSPGKYTLEALLLNIQNEFVRRSDAHPGPWLCAGMAIRLAMRMGYHRDPSAYKQLTPFQGEMRRRVWACILQLDALISWQLGLPAMIHEPQCDTKLPKNLLDEDFGPNDLEIKPGRPMDEMTPILYVICKSELSACFRTIFNRVSLGRTEAYDEIMALHQRLLAVHGSISPRLKMARIQDSMAVSTYVIFRRYSLELLFQKSLCILHRHHMVKAHQETKYSFSRKTCLEAAMAILTHRADMVRETQYGGIFQSNSWLLTSIEQTDFILATMIVSLEVHFLSRTSPRHAIESSALDAGITYSQQDLVLALHQSHAYLSIARSNSEECRVAYDVLAVVLRKFSGKESGTNIPQENMARNVVAASGAPVEDHASMSTTSSSSAYVTGSENFDAAGPSQPPLGWPQINDIESFFDNTDVVDWGMWEEFIRNAPAQ